MNEQAVMWGLLLVTMLLAARNFYVTVGISHHFAPWKWVKAMLFRKHTCNGGHGGDINLQAGLGGDGCKEHDGPRGCDGRIIFRSPYGVPLMVLDGHGQLHISTAVSLSDNLVELVGESVEGVTVHAGTGQNVDDGGNLFHVKRDDPEE